MMRPQKRLPATARVKLRVVVAVLVASAWHLAALFVGVASYPTANGDNTPDVYATMPGSEFAARVLGTNHVTAPMPLTLPNQPMNTDWGARLIGVRMNSADFTEIVLNTWSQGSGQSIRLPYDKVRWRTGDAAAITFAFSPEPITTMFIGEGYSYWRFLTFRGAEHATFNLGEVKYDDDSVITSWQEIVSWDGAIVSITVPNTPEWNGALTLK